jgi:hypothetical protein
MKTPREKIEAAGTAVSTAIQVLKMEQPTFEAFLRECRDMENFGHIVDPTLYKDPERKAVNALMQPLFAAAIIFVAEYERHIAKANAALKKASAA